MTFPVHFTSLVTFMNNVTVVLFTNKQTDPELGPQEGNKNKPFQGS